MKHNRIMNAVLMFSLFICVLLLRYGRRSMLLVSYVSSIVFSIVSAFSSTYIMFAAFRFLTGFALTGIVNISVVLSKFFLKPNCIYPLSKTQAICPVSTIWGPN